MGFIFLDEVEFVVLASNHLDFLHLILLRDFNPLPSVAFVMCEDSHLIICLYDKALLLGGFSGPYLIKVVKRIDLSDF